MTILLQESLVKSIILALKLRLVHVVPSELSFSLFFLFTPCGLQ